MNVLILSKDPTILQQGKNAFGDSMARHIAYAKRLRELSGVNSSIKIITYSKRAPLAENRVIAPGIEVYATRSLHRAFYLLDVIRLLPRVLKHWRPDLITSQSTWEEAVVGLALARALKARFVPQLHFDLFSYAWRRENILNFWRYLVSTVILKKADAVRVVSSGLKKQVIARFGQQEDSVSVIPVGVNFTPVLGVSKHIQKEKLLPEWLDAPVVLFVGRFCAAKNLPLWLDVAQKVSQVKPNARFLLIGDGELLDDIRQKATKYGFGDRMRFLGAIGHAELPAYYASADVFLLTSNHEGYGRVVAEALLSEVPVVATKCGGPEDLVCNQESGYLCEPRDVHGLARAVCSLLDSPDTAETMGRSGRASVLRQFEFHTLVRHLVAFWTQVCETPTTYGQS